MKRTQLLSIRSLSRRYTPTMRASCLILLMVVLVSSALASPLQSRADFPTTDECAALGGGCVDGRVAFCLNTKSGICGPVSYVVCCYLGSRPVG